jgi:anti-anti-sigma factor
LLVLDLSQLEFISSAGLRVLMVAAKRVKARKSRLALCSRRDRV